MFKFSSKAIVVILLTLLTSQGINANIVDVSTPIKKVTVYKEQAKIIRIAECEVIEGSHSVIFKDLPIRVNPSALKASSLNENVSILRLSHKVVNHVEVPQERIGKLVKIIDSLQNNVRRALNDKLDAFNTQKKLLAVFNNDTVDKLSKQLNDGNLNVMQWKEAFNFLGTNMKEINDSIRIVDREIKLVSNLLNKYKLDYSSLRETKSKNTYEVRIDFIADSDAQAKIALEYIMPNASWSPIYNARLTKNKVEITCMADVKQNTGEDWNNIELTLSSANPFEGISPGESKPWFLGREINRSLYKNNKGVIKGYLTNKETGSSVIGASVAISGTTQGAVSDFDGKYIIRNVAPGIYTLKVTSLEYNTIVINDVVVNNYISTKISQSLTKRVSELDAVIFVKGERNIIDKFVTSSEITIGKETIKAQPVTTVDELLSQVTGVVTNNNGEVFIRGGRAFETSHIVEGVPIGDPLGGLGQSGSELSLAEGIKLNKFDFSTTFHIKHKESIQSGNNAVRTSIATYSLNSKIVLLARPENREKIFRVAELTNQPEIPLFPGKVNMFVESDYLGQIDLIDIIVTNQKFKMPFGIDKRIELTNSIKSYNKIWKSSKIITNQINELKFTNNSSDTLEIQIEYPLPLSLDNKVKVKIGSILPEPDEQQENGMTKWKLTFKPHQTQIIEIPFKIEYPKNIRVKGLK